MIVIDASATIALLLNEDGNIATSERVYGLAEDTVIAPSHWAAEVGNSLVTNVRRRRLRQDQLDAMADQLNDLGIQVVPPPNYSEIAEISHYAVETGVTYYDAAYLHMALGRQASLLTLDRKMRAAAARLDIPIFAW